jgi:uncharacterized membrane protein
MLKHEEHHTINIIVLSNNFNVTKSKKVDPLNCKARTLYSVFINSKMAHYLLLFADPLFCLLSTASLLRKFMISWPNNCTVTSVSVSVLKRPIMYDDSSVVLPICCTSSSWPSNTQYYDYSYFSSSTTHLINVLYKILLFEKNSETNYQAQWVTEDWCTHFLFSTHTSNTGKHDFCDKQTF